MIIKIAGLNADFINSINFLEKIEKIKIVNKGFKMFIIIKGKDVAKLRANLNLLFRCLRMYDDIKKWIEV